MSSATDLVSSVSRWFIDDGPCRPFPKASPLVREARCPETALGRSRCRILSAITALGFALLSDNALAQQAADAGPVVGTETTVLASMLDYDHSRLEYRN